MLTFQTRRRSFVLLSSVVGLALLSSCAMNRVNLVEQGRAKLVFVPSDTHAFEKSFLFQDDDELIVYGKVKNLTGFCKRQGHVDLVVIDPEGKILRKASIPYVDRGQRRKGWSGAHFRARFSQKLAPRSTVRIAFDDENCFVSVGDDHNLAMPLSSDTREKPRMQKL